MKIFRLTLVCFFAFQFYSYGAPVGEEGALEDLIWLSSKIIRTIKDQKFNDVCGDLRLLEKKQTDFTKFFSSSKPIPVISYGVCAERIQEGEYQVLIVIKLSDFIKYLKKEWNITDDFVGDLPRKTIRKGLSSDSFTSWPNWQN